MKKPFSLVVSQLYFRIESTLLFSPKPFSYQGLAYCSLGPSLCFFPSFLTTAIGVTNEELIQAKQPLLALFVLLACCVGSSYFIAAKYDCIVSIDLTVLVRTLCVPIVLVGSHLLNEDPFGDIRFHRFVFVVDVVIGLIHGMLGPDGFINGVASRLYYDHVRKNTSKSLQAWFRAAIGCFYMIAGEILPGPKSLSLFISFVACVVPPLYQVGLAKGNVSKLDEIMYRVICIVGILYASETIGINQTILRLQAFGLFCGIFNDGFEISVKSAGAAWLYHAVVTHLTTSEDGIFYFCFCSGFAPILLSYAWISLFYHSYNDSQQRFLKRIHWQDWSMGIMLMLVALTFKKANYLGAGTLGHFIAAYQAPLSLLFFPLVSKYMIHSCYGAPQHPTWWVDSDFPMQAPIEYDYWNFIYAIFTINATLVLCVQVAIALHMSVGLTALFYDEPMLWKFLVTHGLVMIVASGFWMIFASCGIPPFGKQKKYRMVSPYTNMAILQCDPKNCIPPHKFDLVMGLFSTFVGSVLVSKESVLNHQQDELVRSVVFIVWGLGTAWKVYVHVKDFGYEPATDAKPYEEFKIMDAQKSSKKDD